MLAHLGLDDPFVLETHGGRGEIWGRLYSGFSAGAVIEKKPQDAEFLARQRPTWAVYEGQSEKILGAGLFRWQPVDFLDVDPYGEPWKVLEAFFGYEGRALAPKMAVAVNDGLRQNLRIKGGWKIGSMQESVRKYGNDNLRPHYKEIALEKLTEVAGGAGYSVSYSEAYYCGNFNDMTHYGVVLERA